MRFLCPSLAATILLGGAAFAQTSNTTAPAHKMMNRQDMIRGRRMALQHRKSGLQLPRPKDASVSESVLYLAPSGTYFEQQLNSSYSPALGNIFWTSLYSDSSTDLALFASAFSYAPEDQNPFPNEGDIYPYSGATPPVIIGNGEVLYGIANGGGANSQGYIYSYSQSQGFADIYDFTGGSDGGFTAGNVILGSDGLLYGTGFDGGDGNNGTGGGVLFSFNTSTKKLTPLWQFCQVAQCTDSANPAGIVEGHDGNIYGVSVNGGTATYGTLWEYNKSTGQTTTLYSFSGFEDIAEVAHGTTVFPDGGNPFAPPVEIAGHTLAGTVTCSNETPCFGIWSYNLDTQVFTPEYYDLSNASTAYSAPLTVASDGNLYGTSGTGGAYSNGYLFSYTPGTSAITDLWDFGNNNDGVTPTGNVYQGPDALFYTATSGGTGEAMLGPGASALVNLSVQGVTTAPLVLTLPGNAYTGQPLTLSFTSNVMFSKTAQQCYAYSIEHSNGALTTYGPLPGSLDTATGVFTGGGTVPAPAAGVYDVSVVCGGGMTSAASTVYVYTPNTTSLSFSPTSITSGQSGSETITVTGSDSNAVTGGNVSLTCGSINLGSATVTSGSAVFNIPSTAGLAAGSYSCSATYSGTSGYTGSSANQTVTVTDQSTSTSVSSSGGPVHFPGGSVTLTATITGQNYTPNGGYVTFTSGSVNLGVAQVTNGSASVTTTVPNVPPGTYPLNATYSGTNNGSAGSYGSTSVLVGTP